HPFFYFNPWFFYSSLFSGELHKGIYMTSWVAGSQRGTKLLEEVKENNLDAVVIDMKDATGYVVYDSNVDLVEKIGSEDIRIKDKKLEDILDYCELNGIHTIARIVVAKDPVLSRYNNHKFAILDKSTNKPSEWVDLFSFEVQDYNIDIATELVEKGFDEINFDYTRFPDNGEVKKPYYPFRYRFSNGNNTKLYQAVELFLKKARAVIDAEISIDVYAYTLWGDKERHMNERFNNIGQVIEVMLDNVDYIYPMVYPSHFSKSDRMKIDARYDGTEEHDVVYEACKNGLRRVKGSKTKIVPWVQGFWCDDEYIMNELKAVNDSGIDGFFIWNSKNKYEESWKALQKLKFDD
ncbi:putative glycoside hydrolase, partial [Candidatus Woesearchaeota archaeon]|nr:putative glycoside hydrolase [Candidatus Woesearchaeota archaeon]